MTKHRLEAFSDGVFAIIITIMVLELRVPEAAGVDALTAGPQHLHLKFICYVLSFVHVAIYWNNHHHLLHASRRVTASIMWANMHLLFWLSLVPITTGWMGDSHLAALPTAVYGVDLLLAAVAYTILFKTLVAAQGDHSKLAQAVGRDLKGKASLACYALAIPLAFVRPWIAGAIYVLVALIWLVPDRRIERAVLNPK